MSNRNRWAIRYALFCAAFGAYLFSFVSPFYSVYPTTGGVIGFEPGQTIPTRTEWGLRLKGSYSVSLDFEKGRQWQTGSTAFRALWEECSPFCPAWLGHPALWMGLLLLALSRFRGACYASLVGLVFATNLSGMRRGAMGLHWGGWDGIGVGYYLWVGGLLFVLLAGAVGLGQQAGAGRARGEPGTAPDRWSTSAFRDA